MALILSRKPGEDVLVGNDIRFGIVSVKDGKTVSVAISAPKDVRIVRAEIAADQGQGPVIKPAEPAVEEDP